MMIKPLKKEDRKFQMEVHQAEFELIKRIREEYQYGEITIITKNGLPTDIIKEIKRDKVWFGN